MSVTAAVNGSDNSFHWSHSVDFGNNLYYHEDLHLLFYCIYVLLPILFNKELFGE